MLDVPSQSDLKDEYNKRTMMNRSFRTMFDNERSYMHIQARLLCRSSFRTKGSHKPIIGKYRAPPLIHIVYNGGKHQEVKTGAHMKGNHGSAVQQKVFWYVILRNERRSFLYSHMDSGPRRIPEGRTPNDACAIRTIPAHALYPTSMIY